MFVELQGDLFSLMFGYASLVGISKRCGLRPVAWLSCGNQLAHNTSSACTFARFFSLRTSTDGGKCRTYMYEYNETRAPFEPNAFGQRPGALFRGAFHSWKYFEGSEKAIRKAFRANASNIREATTRFTKLDLPSSARVVCIHVCRSGRHPYAIQQVGYYMRAIHHMRRTLSSVSALNFSFLFLASHQEERRWVKQELLPMLSSEQLETYHVLGHDNELDDFVFMQTQCDGVVMSGGSFAWWAAFTSKRTQEVVAPKQLYVVGHRGAHDVDVGDHFPAAWTLI